MVPRSIIHYFLFACLVLTLERGGSAEDSPAQEEKGSERMQELCIVGKSPTFASFSKMLPEDKLQFLSEQGPLELTRDQLVRWGNPHINTERAEVQLVDGTRLAVADAWTVQEQFVLEKKQLRLATHSLGVVLIPRAAIAQIQFKKVFSKQEEARILKRVEVAKPAHEMLLFTNGDQYPAELLTFEKDTLKCETSSGEKILKQKELASVRFYPEKTEVDAEGQSQTLVGLRDGSLLVASSMTASSEKKPIQFSIGCGLNLELADIDEITYLQQLKGSVEYLSDLTPEQYKHTPFMNIARPFFNNLNAMGETLQVDSKYYWKGLGLHSKSQIVYRVEKKYKRFVCQIAIDDGAKSRGSVVFRVLLAKDKKWVEAYKSPVVRGGEAPRLVEVPLDGAAGIALVVDFADYGDELDHANWLDARFE